MQTIKFSETIILLIFIFFSGFLFFAFLQGPKIKQNFSVYNATFAGNPVSVIVADSELELKLGLSQIKKLKRNEVFLMVLPKEAKWRVTTKNINFPIDIFWLDKNMKVVEIQKFAPANSNFIFVPKNKAKYILETNADFAEIYDIQIGDKLIFE